MANGGTEQHFVEILPRGASLPTANYATFQLADIHQPGVTVMYRLNEEQLAALNGTRSVDIGMTLKTDGEFVVSIFDLHDPDHLRKKERYLRAKQQRQQGKNPNHNATLDYKVVDETLSKEQILLIIGCIVLLAFYLAAKLTFRTDLLVERQI
jgi:hypothetical protein